THREAFKTWELSLTGLLVAADVYQRRYELEDPWSIPPAEKELNFDLVGEIRRACDSISTYDDFVKRLTILCEPDVKVFKTFGPALEKAHALLRDYWTVIRDPKMTQKERQKASLERVQRLEKEGISDAFYAE